MGDVVVDPGRYTEVCRRMGHRPWWRVSMLLTKIVTKTHLWNPNLCHLIYNFYLIQMGQKVDKFSDRILFV